MKSKEINDSNLVDLSQVNSEEEEAFCAVIDYCNCGICAKSGKCQLSPQHMCLKGRVYYDGFIKGAKLSKAGAEWAEEHPKNVWHDASEEPTTESTRVLATDEKGFIDVFSLEKGKFKIPNGCIPWSSIVVCFNLTKWAYIDDLLPKGGEK